MLGKLILALACDVGVWAAQDDHVLTLIQLSSKALESEIVDAKGAKLPNVRDVLAAPTEVYQGLNTKAQKFETQIAALQQKGADAVRKRKAKYEKNLTQQHHELESLREENNRIWGEVDELKEFISRTRATCSDLEKSNAQLREGLRSIRSNTTVALEFADQAISALDNMTDLKSGTLAVLAEMEEKETRERKERLLKEIDGGIKLGLLQIDAVRKPGSVDEPDDLLQSLIVSVHAWQAQQNQSEVAFRVAFEAEYQKGEANRTAILEDQRKANETKTSLLDVKEQLIEAQAELEKTHDRLMKDTKALHTFAKRLGEVVQVDEDIPHSVLSKAVGLAKVRNSVTADKPASEAVHEKVERT